jgi:apoptosis-inducing factor 2
LQETKVTLVHSQDKLFTAAYPDKFRNWTLTRIQRSGVNVVLNDAIENVEISAGSVTTKKGKAIKADLVVSILSSTMPYFLSLTWLHMQIPTWGGRPNTSIVSSSLSPDLLSKTGHVLVERTLQVKGHPRIFAVGDIIEWNEQKQAGKVGAHSGVVAPNVLTLASGTGGALKEYKGSSELIVVTFGRVRVAASSRSALRMWYSSSLLVWRYWVLWRPLGHPPWGLVRPHGQVQRPHDRDGSRELQVWKLEDRWSQSLSA